MIPILAYHLISDKPDLGIARTTTRQFARQMAWLHDSGYRTITLADFAKILRGEHAGLPEKPIVLTFDDSYASLDFAAEVMQRYGFVGTAFVISDYVGKQNAWDYQFFVRKFRHADKLVLLDLIRSGWEIGSHTKTHRYLPALDERDLRDELVDSKAALDALLQIRINAVSYPFGRADTRVCDFAMQAGYSYGVRLGVAKARSPWAAMQMPRLGVYLWDTLAAFTKKVRGFSDNKRIEFFKQDVISFFSYGTVLFKKIVE